jgi:hypothetical protein
MLRKVLQVGIFVSLGIPYAVKGLVTKSPSGRTAGAGHMFAMMWDISEPVAPAEHERRLRVWQDAADNPGKQRRANEV